MWLICCPNVSKIKGGGALDPSVQHLVRIFQHVSWESVLEFTRIQSHSSRLISISQWLYLDWLKEFVHFNNPMQMRHFIHHNPLKAAKLPVHMRRYRLGTSSRLASPLNIILAFLMNAAITKTPPPCRNLDVDKRLVRGCNKSTQIPPPTTSQSVIILYSLNCAFPYLIWMSLHDMCLCSSSDLVLVATEPPPKNWSTLPN